MNYIRHYRLAKGLTLQQLGDMLDPIASPGTLSAYESGKRNIGQTRLRQIAEALGVSQGSLLDPPPSNEEEISNVIDLWDHIPENRREQAIEVLKTFVDKGA